MRTSTSSYSRFVVVGLLLCVVAGWGFYLVGLDTFLEAAYSGESWSYFNEYAARWRSRQTDPSLGQFLEEAHALLFRFGLLGTVVVGLTAGTWWVRPQLLSSFFSEKTSPFNLALFRIAVFGTLFAFDLEEAQWYAQLPETLQFPPPGLSSILSVLTTDPAVVSAMSVIFQIACLFGLFGFYTRISATVALISGLYVLGIPQFYGKINHYHHILWFTALLASSRCADVLSLDALRMTRSSSSVASPTPERAYALPLRYAWILLGIVYFFPGIWKFAGEGFAWAFGENLKYRMHSAWFTKSFTPLFRLDLYPLLYKGAGAFTILFEIGFIFTLPFRALRPWMAGIAFLFHESTRLFLAITFWTLYPILPFLLDLRSFFVRLGRGFGVPLTLVYDGRKDWERRLVEILLRMDLFGRIQIREQEREALENERCLAISAEHSNEEALWVGERLQWTCIPRLVASVPPVILLVPLLPLAKRGMEPSFGLESRRTGMFFVTVVGSFLIAANVLCGVAKVNSYPFSVYPTFAVRAAPTATTLRVEGTNESGRPVEILGGAHDHEQSGFSAARFKGFVRSIRRIDDEETRTEKLNALWKVLQERRSDLRSITEVRFYKATYSTNPDSSSNRLLDRSLLTTIDVSSQSPAAGPETD